MPDGFVEDDAEPLLYGGPRPELARVQSRYFDFGRSCGSVLYDLDRKRRSGFVEARAPSVKSRASGRRPSATG